MEFNPNELRADAPVFVPALPKISSREDALNELSRIMSFPKAERTYQMYLNIAPYLGNAFALIPGRHMTPEMAVASISVSRENIQYIPENWRRHPVVLAKLLLG